LHQQARLRPRSSRLISSLLIDQSRLALVTIEPCDSAIAFKSRANCATHPVVVGKDDEGRYLKDLFTRLPAAKITAIKEFTPAVWAKANEKLLAQAA